MVEDNWLLGTGLGTFRDVFPAYRPAHCGIDAVWTRAHNFYMEGWIVSGIIFPILTFIAIIWLYEIFAKGLRTRKLYRWVPAVGIGMLTTVIIHSAIDFSLQIPGFAIHFPPQSCLAVSRRRFFKPNFTAPQRSAPRHSPTTGCNARKTASLRAMALATLHFLRQFPKCLSKNERAGIFGLREGRQSDSSYFATNMEKLNGLDTLHPAAT